MLNIYNTHTYSYVYTPILELVAESLLIIKAVLSFSYKSTFIKSRSLIRQKVLYKVSLIIM